MSSLPRPGDSARGGNARRTAEVTGDGGTVPARLRLRLWTSSTHNPSSRADLADEHHGSGCGVGRRSWIEVGSVALSQRRSQFNRKSSMTEARLNDMATRARRPSHDIRHSPLTAAGALAAASSVVPTSGFVRFSASRFMGFLNVTTLFLPRAAGGLTSAPVCLRSA
jgi:hypothetical protein